MAKDRSGLPRFLFVSNPLVNDQLYILHTAKPNCLLKVIQQGRITAQVVRLYDEETTREELNELEKEAATKFYYYTKSMKNRF